MIKERTGDRFFFSSPNSICLPSPSTAVRPLPSEFFDYRGSTTDRPVSNFKLQIMPDLRLPKKKGRQQKSCSFLCHSYHIQPCLHIETTTWVYVVNPCEICGVNRKSDLPRHHDAKRHASDAE